MTTAASRLDDDEALFLGDMADCDWIPLHAKHTSSRSSYSYMKLVEGIDTVHVLVQAQADTITKEVRQGNENLGLWTLDCLA